MIHLQCLLVFIVGLLAPFYVPFLLLFGLPAWAVTPDDLESPYGAYEPTMRMIYGIYGKFIGDWWWLGVRNSSMGIAYKFKPNYLKGIPTYAYLPRTVKSTRFYDLIKVWKADFELTLKFGLFHVIYGRRLKPIINDNDLPVRSVNMDGRPILSIRWGKPE